jgi:radical SAM superfamily enzyme YgiQ (UPF0313 family)
MSGGNEQPYTGFEQGPIRPPSEAGSLLIRVSRNCPWNRCAFCPVYKGAKFSLRPVEHVLRDIDAARRQADAVLALGANGLPPARERLNETLRALPEEDRGPFAAACHWIFAGGMANVFLQDANALFMRTDGLVRILEHLRRRFPEVRRVTAYARSHTVANKPADELRALAQAGLNRVHIGMESGSDAVLERVKKGVTKAQQVEAGQKVKAAGMELSEYVMPGLGGRALSETHARESADALNRINPDFIRLRTLAIPGSTPLFEEWESGRFDKMTETETVAEIALFIECLDGIDSELKSDHILNLLGELDGRLPGDKPRLLALCRRFLDLPPAERALFQVGRRIGRMHRLDDLDDPAARAGARQVMAQFGVTPDNVDAVTDALMRQFI